VWAKRLDGLGFSSSRPVLGVPAWVGGGVKGLTPPPEPPATDPQFAPPTLPLLLDGYVKAEIKLRFIASQQSDGEFHFLWLAFCFGRHLIALRFVAKSHLNAFYQNNDAASFEKHSAERNLAE
jgi:hypothetical protein